MEKAEVDPPLRELYTITYKNGTIVEYRDLNDIFSQDNHGNYRITQIDISLSRSNQDSAVKTEELFINLIFSDPSESNFKDNYSVFYKVLGIDRDWVFVTSSMIQDRVEKVSINTYGINILKRIEYRFIFFTIITFIVLILYSIYETMQPYEPISSEEVSREKKEIKGKANLPGTDIDYGYFEDYKNKLYTEIYDSEINKISNTKLNTNSLKEFVVALKIAEEIKDSCEIKSNRLYYAKIDSVSKVNETKIDSIENNDENVSVFSEKYPLTIYDKLRIREIEKFKKRAHVPYLIMFGIPMLLYIIFVFLHKYYPLYNFLWGDYNEVYQKRVRVLKIIISTLISGVILGVFVEKLADYF
ncbi:MAG: hypothetical protein H6569_05980 [Lewinellaceae bacterium]|nr:hypothetical protein [Lewinellaceae bacterium]